MIEAMNLAEAEALDREICTTLNFFAAAIDAFVEALGPLIERAKAGEMHLALGFRSWVEYLADRVRSRLGARLGELHPDDRRVIVEALAMAGMSNTAVADAVGVSRETARSDRIQINAERGARNLPLLPTFVTCRSGRTRPANVSMPPRQPPAFTPLPDWALSPAEQPPPATPAPDEPTEEDPWGDRLERLKERARGFCRDVRWFMAELASVSNEDAGWICLEILNATGEVQDVADEFRDWYLAILNRWEADEKEAVG
jgi:hypothetical protein